MKKIPWPGRGWKATCMRCGFQFPSTELRKEWTGLYVCEKDYETRHEQTLIKVRGEKATPTFVSKDSDIYLNVCTVVTSSGYADMGVADCMKADNNSVAYSALLELNTNGHGGM